MIDVIYKNKRCSYCNNPAIAESVEFKPICWKHYKKEQREGKTTSINS